MRRGSARATLGDIPTGGVTVKAVVVYESAFENTRDIADAIAEGARQGADVAVCSVNDASLELLGDAQLLVVGGPTHMHGMTSSASRKMARDVATKKGEEADPSMQGPGLRAWFHSIPRVNGTMGAAFDTRLPGSALKTGSAAKGIARRLRQHGYELVADAESFIVEDAEGPLSEGELERARTWGASLAKDARPTS
jgi:hypothetical protein